MTRLVIISGRSGSGKSTALQALEDLGHYCVDNLPLALLPTFGEILSAEQHHVTHAAVGIDARNLPHQLPRFVEIVNQVRNQWSVEVIFLDADRDILLRRFNATRRKHPLGHHGVPLSEAIDNEGLLLANIREHADLVIDTGNLDPHVLRNMVRERIAGHQNALSLLIESFGFLNGVPRDADLVFDVRVLANPHWLPELRDYLGTDAPVRHFLGASTEAQQMLSDITDFLTRWLPHYAANDRSYMTVAIGCTGGKHRSVYIASELASRLTCDSYDIQVRHRELRE